MVSLTARRCAAALLCAALVLASVCAHAASISVTDNVSQTGSAFNGDSVTFDLTSSSPSVVTVQLISSTVTGSGLDFKGYTDSVPAGVTTRVSMSVVSTTVTDATISFAGVMPANADIRFASTTGTLAAAQSLFDFSGLQLTGNVTLTVEESSVSWPAGTNTGSIVTYSGGTTAASIGDRSALFILNATATNGASVLHVNIGATFNVKDNAILAIDYGRCVKCASAMVDIDDALVVDNSSLFRVSHGTVVEGTGGLLASAASVTVSDSSLYVISDCTIDAGNSFFDYDSGAESSAASAFNFAVTGGSTVSYLNLEGPATGIPSAHRVPSVVTDSTVNAGNCVINGNALTTVADYESNGIAATTVVDANGAITTGSNAGSCGNVICVPGHSASSSTADSSGVCSCTCNSADYAQPSCTGVSDPTQSYGEGGSCAVADCATCDRLYPNTRCSACNKGYKLNGNYQCDLIPSTSSASGSASDTTSTTTTTTTSSSTSTSTTALCTVPYCERCLPAVGSTCASCRNGYTLSSGSCIANFNGASAAQSAVLAAVVCAAAVYAL